jgi:hypothetical protein
LVIGIATGLSPVLAPRTVGSLLILAVFSGTAGVLLCLMALKPRFAVGAIAYVLIAAIFFSPNDHRVPQVKSQSRLGDLDDTFAQWLASRADLGAYRSREKPYPVILVSSEGGGIYAAAHAYGTLSAIQQRCPTFSQHIFATVGVSGGALGNLLFVGSTSPRQEPSRPCEPRTMAVNGEPVLADHLSPVLARLLLLETVDRLTPGSLLDRDRAQILSDSFLDIATDKQYARLALSESFQPKDARPAVISVAVDVSTGRRVVLSPIRPSAFGQTAQWWPGDAVLADEEKTDEYDIRLVDAAGLSARFPWITPTGRLRTRNGKEVILADGGYFENSGADTVFDLLLSLTASDRWEHYQDTMCSGQGCVEIKEIGAQAEPCSRTSVVLVNYFHGKVQWKPCQTPVFIIHLALASSEPDEESSESPGPHSSPQQSFLADPLSVLLATRKTRGEIALRHMDVELCGTKIPGSECYGHPGNSFGMFRNDISPEAWKLPLGWFMSRPAFNRIVEETAPRRWFDYHAQPPEYPNDTQYLIYHLDPALYDADADPSIDELMGAP